ADSLHHANPSLLGRGGPGKLHEDPGRVGEASRLTGEALFARSGARPRNCHIAGTGSRRALPGNRGIWTPRSPAIAARLPGCSRCGRTFRSNTTTGAPRI